MHLDVEQTERLLAGELLDDEASARAHLTTCGDCAGRLQAARQADAEVGELLRLIDRPQPRVSVHTLMNARPRKRFDWGMRAASIVLFLGVAAAAAALPGSPLRKWLGLERTAVVDSPVVAPAQPAGLALEPGPSLTITFARAGSGEAIVSLSDSNLVVVQARGGAASFNSEDDRLLIDNHDPAASFELRIPRNAPHVQVRIGERRVFLKRGSEVSADVVGSAGSYVIPLRR